MIIGIEDFWITLIKFLICQFLMWNLSDIILCFNNQNQVCCKSVIIET